MTKMTKMTKKQKPNKERVGPISAKELKFWLEGILEFQPAGWVPTKDQWDNIKNKIFSLYDAEPSNFFNENNMRSNPIQNLPQIQQDYNVPNMNMNSYPDHNNDSGGNTSPNDVIFQGPVRLTPEQERAAIEAARANDF